MTCWARELDNAADRTGLLGLLHSRHALKRKRFGARVPGDGG